MIEKLHSLWIAREHSNLLNGFDIFHFMPRMVSLAVSEKIFKFKNNRKFPNFRLFHQNFQ